MSNPIFPGHARGVLITLAALAASPVFAQDPDARGIVEGAAPARAAVVLHGPRADVAPGPNGGPDPTPASAGYRSLHFLAGVQNGFVFPFHVTVAGNDMFVSDVNAQNVQMFTFSGGFYGFVRNLGTSTAGSAAGQFNGPEQVAVVGSDVFIADFSNNRVQRFNRATGAYISQFGAGGTGAGQFAQPTGLIYNARNNLLYVSEVGNDRIQVFTTGGVFVRQFGTAGTGNGQLNNPFGLAVDSAGNIYAADTGNNRVVKFDLNGNFVRNIAVGVSGPTAVTVDNANLVWVNSAPGDIYAYEANGAYVAYYYGNLAAGTDGYFNNIRGLAAIAPTTASPFLGAGGIAAVDAGTGTQRVQIFTRSTQPVAHAVMQSIPNAGSFNGQVAFDSQQNIYVTSYSGNTVTKFDKFGTLITSWGAPGTGNGQFNGPYGITVDDQDRVFVVDRNNQRVQRFSATGVYQTQWGSAGSGNGQFNSPGNIATDGAWIYVTDESNHRVQKFSLEGTYVRQWGANGTGNGQMINPVGIAVDRNRNKVYVSEYLGNRIQEFTVFGDFVKVFADSISGTGKVVSPRGLTIDQQGNLYCADGGNSRLVHFSDNGTYLDNFVMTGTTSAIGLDPANGQIWVGMTSGGMLHQVGSPLGKSDVVGVYRPGIQTFLLRRSLTTGNAEISAQVAGATGTDVPLTGDWNGDGIDTPGLFRPASNTFYLWDRWSDLSIAAPDYQLAFCTTNDRPLVGDWNGDNRDSVGCYRASNNTHYLKNSLVAGAEDYAAIFGMTGDVGIGGDWDRDGVMSPGTFRAGDGRFHLSGGNSTGLLAEIYAPLLGQVNDLPVAGDWTHSGYSGIGVFRRSNATYYLKYSLDNSAPNSTFVYAPSDPGVMFADGFETIGGSATTDLPVIGLWGSVPE